jgi:hypothetical protein
LLAFDGRIHHLEQGYWLKFEIKRVEATPERPHGLSYSFTLHDPDGMRLLGFDNAHGVVPLGSGYQRDPGHFDHWHRTGNDAGRPYTFSSADQLVADFFAEVRRTLQDLGVGDDVLQTSERQQGERDSTDE